MNGDLWVIEVGSQVVGIVRGEGEALLAAEKYLESYDGNDPTAFVDGPMSIGMVPCVPKVGHLVARRG